MARHTRMHVLNTIYEVRLVPVFYEPHASKAKKIVKALREGGCPLAEFTNRGDHAWEVFSELEQFRAAECPDVVLGVGSILDPGSASLYINSGADFVVGPVLNPEVARACNRRKIPYSPGCGSASEISQAEELGCEIIKVFPGGQVGGPDFVKAVRGPCPWTSIMPTGDVSPTEESLKAWFGAGVASVGMGSKLITKDMVENDNWDGIAEAVKKTLTIIRSLK